LHAATLHVVALHIVALHGYLSWRTAPARTAHVPLTPLPALRPTHAIA
jgi:hypothetical protein